LVEKAGSGIKRIQRLAKDDNINIEFKTGMFFEVVFYRKIVVFYRKIQSKSDANRTQKQEKNGF